MSKPQPQPGDLEAGLGAVAATTAAPKALADDVKAPAAAAKKVAVAETEDPRLRWAFVRKVYCILALQFAFTAGIAAAACYVRAVQRFLAHGRPAAVWPVFIAVLVSPLIGAFPPPLPSVHSDLVAEPEKVRLTPRGWVSFTAMWPMVRYRERHPLNLVLLGVFTLCCSLSIAVSASFTVGMDIPPGPIPPSTFCARFVPLLMSF
jgi:protein lifeguard